MKLTIQFLDGKHLHPKLNDIDHPDLDETVVNIIRIWMTLIIQMWMLS